jgi:hypothetical protein
MKLTVLILSILFVFSALADCCVSSPSEVANEIAFIQFEAIETQHNDNCSDPFAHTAENLCHCFASCHFKIFSNTESKSLHKIGYYTINFPDYQNAYEFLNPFLLFHPPSA